jgi:hypothetical protein
VAQPAVEVRADFRLAILAEAVSPV